MRGGGARACNFYMRELATGARSQTGDGWRNFRYFARQQAYFERNVDRGGVVFRSVMLRFVLPVALASCVVAYFGLPYIQRLLAEWFTADVELRAQLVMHTMEGPLTELVEQGNEARLHGYLAENDGGRAPAGRPRVPAGRHGHREDRAAAESDRLRCRRAARQFLVGADRAAAVRLGAGVAIRLRFRAAHAVPGRDAVRPELRRSAAANRARFRAGVHRHLGAAARAAAWCWSRGCSFAAGSTC